MPQCSDVTSMLHHSAICWCLTCPLCKNAPAPNISETKLQKLKLFFFSLKQFSVFDCIQRIVAVAGDLRNTMEPSHNNGQMIL